MAKPTDRAMLAAAAMVAMEPLIEFLIDIGVTSPEAESLFRGLFVHTARDWLKDRQQVIPSDVQVALITGIHRNFVREILKSKPKIAATRRSRGTKVERLVEAWRSDLNYVDRHGVPLAISRVAPEPSLRSLVRKYAPGLPLEGTVAQLLRSGLILALNDGRFGLAAAWMTPKSISYAKVREMGTLARDYLEALRAELAK